MSMQSRLRRPVDAGKRSAADRPSDGPGEERLDRLARARFAQLVMPPFDCIT